ncbi:MAG: hypothetical protein QNJ98_05635 [Planctomycetota bacterium]|nr:hypothetical protein [Planctomycetota bacterium]
MSTRRGLPLPLLILLVIGVPAAIGGIWMFGGDAGEDSDVPISAPLERGPMRLSVLEAGALEALESFTIRSQVEGRAEIISLIEEGRVLTQEDVEKGTVLVKLDDSSLKEKLDKQRIDVAASENAFKTAKANLEIQLEQNASDKRKAALDVRFAELDLERYVGKGLGGELLDAHRAISTEAGGTDGEAALVTLISSLFESPQLKGEALQKRRQLITDIQLATEERTRAQVKLDWSKRLESKGYASKDDLEVNRLAFERRKVELERAETALEQYQRYDFPKEVESLLSELVDARDREARVEKKATSNERKARSELVTKQRQRDLQQTKLDKYLNQLEMCVIKATRPGLVVYASSGKDRGWRDNDLIAEGTSVRQRQAIITIPTPGSLGARVNVHESVVDKIRPGLPCKIVVDALPGREIEGVVLRRAPLPNSVNRWMNPDLKVYATMIELLDEPVNLKPGMSCNAEIILGELDDVLAVPVQAIGGSVDKPAVWVWNGEQGVRREVTLGPSNDRYVQVLAGLETGDRVVLDPPRESARDRKAEEDRASADGPPAKSERSKRGGGKDKGKSRAGR